jgi:hypothetical protein
MVLILLRLCHCPFLYHLCRSVHSLTGHPAKIAVPTHTSTPLSSRLLVWTARWFSPFSGLISETSGHVQLFPIRRSTCAQQKLEPIILVMIYKLTTLGKASIVSIHSRRGGSQQFLTSFHQAESLLVAYSELNQPHSNTKSLSRTSHPFRGLQAYTCSTRVFANLVNSARISLSPPEPLNATRLPKFHGG